MGLAIDPTWLPDQLQRYVLSKEAALRVIAGILGEVARADVESGLYSLSDAFADVARHWAVRIGTSSLQLCGPGSDVWASCQLGQTVPGGARDLTDALALPARGMPGEPVVKLEYPTNQVAGHRFPTVADAKWYPFTPAPEVPPDPDDPRTCCGWTGARNGQENQPELLHDNADMAILNGPPSLIGVL